MQIKLVFSFCTQAILYVCGTQTYDLRHISKTVIEDTRPLIIARVDAHIKVSFISFDDGASCLYITHSLIGCNPTLDVYSQPHTR